MVDIIAHRGCPAYAPENTITAVEAAAPHVDMIEIDVRRCGSGELVVFHDEYLVRLTETHGAVSETDWQTLSAMTVGASESGIPLLSDLLDAVPDAVGVNVELKHDGMAADLRSIAADVGNEILVSSFHPSALSELEGAGFPLAYLFEDDGWEAALDRAADLDCAYVHPEYPLVDTDRVAAAHDRGLAVNTWTVPTAAEVERVRNAGVDGVIVDDWAIVRRDD
ncbi:glycerophosphodiester phosphodiesterase [Haloferacaceae archaeon DSL9]